MKNQTRFVLALFLSLIVVVFAVLNVDSTIINFGFAKVHLPLIVILILALLLGALIALLLSTMSSVSLRRQNKKLAQELADTQQQQQVENNKAIEKAEQDNILKLTEQARTISELQTKLDDSESRTQE